MLIISDASMSADRGVYVALCFPTSQPILVVSHVEEVCMRILATRVPWVKRDFSINFLDRFLDIPKDVRGQLFEDFLGRRHLHRWVESAA